MTFSQSDQRRLDAAEGWVGLRNFREAALELSALSTELQRHPAVLKVRWEICSAEKDWQQALEFASSLIEATPNDPIGWVHRSYALHELKRTEEARDNLLRVVDQYPTIATMRYNLACYECQLGRPEQAKTWLEQAFALGDARKMKLAAFDDPDLEPLWRKIGAA